MLAILLAMAFGAGAADEGGGGVVEELETFDEGDWVGDHAVYVQPTFVAVMDEMGTIEIQPMDGKKEVGKPFICYRVAAYYTKPNADHILGRPIISFDSSPKPRVLKSGDKIHLKGTLEDDIPFEAEWEFKANTITASGGCKDPRSISFPTNFRLLTRFPQSHDISPQTEQAERERILKSCFLLTKERDQKRRKSSKHPYYEIMKFHHVLDEAEVRGPYAPRVVLFRGIRGEGRLCGWIYADSCPWQGYVIQYITQGKKINLRRNKTMLMIR